MSKSIVVIGDGQMASMLCSFPGVLGYVKPKHMDFLYNTAGDRIEKLDPEKHVGVLGIANPVHKKESTADWENLGYELGVLLHPAASILGDPQIGGGSVIFPFAFIDNESIIGKSTYIGGHTAIHKSRVEDFAHLTFGCQLIMSTVEEGAILGSNTTVLDCRKVGSYSIVGAGSVVHKNVPPNHKLIQKVKEKLVPLEKIDWSEDYFQTKAKHTS